MALRTLGSGLSSCLLVAALLGACVTGDDSSAPSVQVATQQVTDAPPQAAFTVLCIDRTCHGDAETSSDDVFIANYSWNWGDGVVTSGGSGASAPSHTYAAFGPAVITLTVTDSIGQTSVASRTLQLVQGPTAAFTFSCFSDTCSVNASGSTSPVAITNYHWDWDDETTTDTTSVNSFHAFSYAASFGVHLTVTDAHGLSNGITHAIVIP